MATYKLREKSYVDDRFVEKDETVTVSADVLPGPHWEPVDLEAKRIYLSFCETGQFVGPAPRDLDLAPFVQFDGVNVEQLAAQVAAEHAVVGKRARAEA
jgi:hypothetical protein